jgi:hypothetical protein
MLATTRVQSFDRRQRRILLARSIGRIVGVTVVLLVAYFAAPVGQESDSLSLLILVVGLIGFLLLLTYQVKRILDSPTPQLRAVEALATVVPLVIVTFALVYVAISSADAGGFSEPIDKINGLYFTVTVLSTVGFGDITPRTDGPRIAVTVQMLMDLLIVGVVVKVLVGASRIAIDRRRSEATSGSVSGTDA